MVNSMSINPVTAIAATVQVMDQHGKVVHETGKTFFSAFREAKDAYKAKKAEIAAQRRAESRVRNGLRRKSSSTHTPRHLHGSSRLAIEDVPEHAESSAVVKHKRHRRRRNSSQCHGGGGDISEDENFHNDHTLIHYCSNDTLHTEDGIIVTPGASSGALVTENVMGMAPAIFNDPSVKAVSDMLVNVQSIIDELQCWTAGLSALISELQKAPDTLAAVGLALAEISSLVTKVSPIALPILKSSFPTVFALLSSPHFAIVAGIGAAATVVVLGGFKIVKSVMAGAEENRMLAEENDHGEILGEVMEDHLIEPSRYYSSPKPIVELPPSPPPIDQRPSAMRALEAPPPPTLEVMGFDLKEDKKRRKAEKEERRREKEGKGQRRHEKDERQQREKEDKDERKIRKERKEKGCSGSSSGCSAISRSISSGVDKELKEKRDKDKKPKKAMSVVKGLFDGRSAK